VRDLQPPPQPGAYDQDVEQLSQRLKRQVKQAKRRISEHLQEDRSFEPKRPA
jgi:hypothetical protein